MLTFLHVAVAGVPISARDILGDPKLKEGVKAFT